MDTEYEIKYKSKSEVEKDYRELNDYETNSKYPCPSNNEQLIMVLNGIREDRK